MRYRDIVEGRDGYLYHFMRYDKAMDVLSTDCMPAKWTHNIDGRPHKGNSFTRNRTLNVNPPVVLVVDQRLLAARHKIVPVDGEWVFLSTNGYKPARDRTARRPVYWNEEFVLGDIKPLHEVVVKIKLRDPQNVTLNGDKAIKLFEAVERYCHEHAIIFEISDRYQKLIDDVRERWLVDD